MLFLAPPSLTVIDRASRPFFPRRALYYYARGKMRWDPAYPLLARCLLDSGRPILDLGCGAGVFAAYLREQGVRAPLLGIDLSREKITVAQEWVAARYDALTFVVGDVAEAGKFLSHPEKWSGDMVALDVLHYFSDSDRQAALQHWLSLLPAQGRLFLRNGVRDVCGWRHVWTQLEESWVRSSCWIRGGAWNFPSRQAVESELRSAGARAVVSLPLWGRTPFSSYFFVATAG